MPQSIHENTLFGHPKGLFLLFSSEMWERFSYYGMRALLVLFLTHGTLGDGFGWSSKEALRLYGTYTMLVYFTPLIGGWLADRYLGLRKAIIIGAVMMVFGHFLMAGPALVPKFIETHSGVDVHKIMQESGVSLGHTIDESLASGKTVFETLEAHVASLPVTPEEKQRYLEHTKNAYQWVSATFYVALSLIIIGNGFFKPNISTVVGRLYEPGDHRRDGGFTIFYMGINLGAFLGSLVAGGLGEWLGWHYGFSAAGVGMLCSLIGFIFLQNRYLGDIGKEPAGRRRGITEDKSPLTGVERDRIKVILVMGVFTIVFWAGFEQAGGAMNLFAYEHTDRNLFGFEVPATWFQTLNPLFIVVFAPVVALIWIRLGDKEPNSPLKFSLGMVLLAVGFLCMVGAAFQLEMGGSGKSSMLWLVGAYFFHTMGELCLSPIGLSMVTKLAPLRLAALLMGCWFLFVAAANKLAGFLGGYTEDLGPLAIFGGIAITAIIAGALLYLLSDKLVDWMHGAETPGHGTDAYNEGIGVTAEHEQMDFSKKDKP